jgi:hypothetical protein
MGSIQQENFDDGCFENQNCVKKHIKTNKKIFLPGLIMCSLTVFRFFSLIN